MIGGDSTSTSAGSSSATNNSKENQSKDTSTLNGLSSVNLQMEPMGELDGALHRLASSTMSSWSLLNLSNSPKQVFTQQWQKMKSWGQFGDTNRMKTPSSTMLWSRRLVRNIEHFQSNYMCVFLILVIYCVLTSPLLLLAIAASLGACYIVALKNAESPVKIFRYQMSLAQQYLIVALLSFPLFHLAGAGSAVFWVLGASFFVIGLHASIYAIEMQDSIEEPFRLLKNPIQSV